MMDMMKQRVDHETLTVVFADGASLTNAHAEAGVR